MTGGQILKFITKLNNNNDKASVSKEKKSLKLPNLKNIDKIIKEAKNNKLFLKKGTGDATDIHSYEFNEFKRIGGELDIPEVFNLSYIDFENNKAEIFIIIKKHLCN